MTLATTGLSAIAAGIAERGFAVTSGLLDSSLIADLQAEVRALREEGAFRPSHVGRGGNREVRSEIRSDHILWIDPATPSPAQAEWLSIVEALRLEINRTLFLGAFDYEGMLAVYRPGAFYRRHLDVFRDTQARVITLSLYLNDGWTVEDGGALRMWQPGADPDVDEPMDVLPEAGRLVVFRSDVIWHEVLPAHRERHSLTGWLRRRT